MTSLDDRLENWANCYRDRLRQGTALSFEGRSRSNRGNEVEWATGVWLGSGTPAATVARDWRDAEIINNAWQAIPHAYHQTILGAWYVRRWAPTTCLAKARHIAGWTRLRTAVSAAEFEQILILARSLLAYQLMIPAVVRRKQLSSRVRAILGLEQLWSTLDTAPPMAFNPSHNPTSASA